MKITTFQERLNELFNSDPRSDTAIAAELDVSKQALSAWRKGTRSPKKPILIKIAQMYHVSLEWLMGFDVPRETVHLNTSDSVLKEDPEIRIVSGMMETMSKEQREQIVAIVRAVVGTTQKG